MSAPKNFNRYGYIKYIAACDLFLKLAAPLKAFIAFFPCTRHTRP